VPGTLSYMNKQPVKTLTIGGSDSGGAAGIQADLKTWTALGVYGMSVITAVTAQNSLRVEAIHYLPPDVVGVQIDAVLFDYGTQAVKTGFLGQIALIHQVAWHLKAHNPEIVVIDPVLVNHKGQSMFGSQVAGAYMENLIPLASLATPNWREAALLTGVNLRSEPQFKIVKLLCEKINAAGARQVLITGVPGTENTIVDWWFDGLDLHPFEQPKIETRNIHGSGDTLSAAICANLALGMDMGAAIGNAQTFTSRAMAAATGWQLGQGHGPLSHFVNNKLQV
jgi:hydroxymethylpyrimidine/phosphomethylpyrimidine kinase